MVMVVAVVVAVMVVVVVVVVVAVVVVVITDMQVPNVMQPPQHARHVLLCKSL